MGHPNPRHPKSGEPRVLLWTVVALMGAFLVLRYVVPWVAVWVGASPRPAPVPRFALVIYMLSATVGALLYVSADDRRWQLFWAPVWRTLALSPGPGWRVRVAVLAAVPLAAGWVTWQRVVPRPAVPTVVRLQHPTLPEAYADSTNPFEALSDSLRQREVRAGVVLYQQNCRPCHGAAATGDGPLARGLRLRPIDFTDAGTIASVVESYPFWRVRQGQHGLPGIATPWNSAMPAWGDAFTEDDVWRIIMAEYHIAGREPRRPEGR